MFITFIRSSCYNSYKIPSMCNINIFFLFIILIHSHPNAIFVHAAGDHDPIPVSSAEFWGQIMAIFALVVCSGIVAGLTLGLMSQDVTNLAILSAAGTAKQQKHAARIMPIRKNGHVLLTALLLTNTVLNETLPILCDGLFGQGYVAVIISTALIVIFAEIIPQAVCSRHGLAIGAFFAIPVRVLIGFWYILAWPIARLLDTILGKHSGILYGIAELRELINLHSEEPLTNNAHVGGGDEHHPGPLQKSTVEILRNTLDLSLYSAGDLVNPARQPFMLHIDTKLDRENINTILQSECTVIPVYRYRNSSDADHNHIPDESHRIILGVLKTKYLSVLDPADKTPLSKIALEPVLQVSATTSATMLLQMLENDSNRMAEVFMPMGPPTVSSNTIEQVKEEAVVPMSYNYPYSKKEQEIEYNNKNNNMNNQVSPRQVNGDENDGGSKRGPASCRITRIFRHQKRPEDLSNNNKNINETNGAEHRINDEKQHQLPALNDSSSTQSSSSYTESHSPYAQDALVLGVITFEEVLVRLITSDIITIHPHHYQQEDPALLTDVLIHTKENNYNDDHESNGINGADNRNIQQHHYHHRRHETDRSITSIHDPQKQSWTNQRRSQSTADIYKKAKEPKEDKAESCRSSSSNTTESTVISKPNSFCES